MSIRSGATTHGSRIGSASRGILIRLVTGASWVDIEAIMDFEVFRHHAAGSP